MLTLDHPSAIEHHVDVDHLGLVDHLSGIEHHGDVDPLGLVDHLGLVEHLGGAEIIVGRVTTFQRARTSSEGPTSASGQSTLDV